MNSKNLFVASGQNGQGDLQHYQYEQGQTQVGHDEPAGHGTPGVPRPAG
jgi:hypothetical protein